MNHDEIRELIHSHVDGELDLINAREVEQHLRGCDECSRAAEQIRVLHEALTSNAPAYRAPAHLRRNIRKVLRREANVSERTLSSWLTLATGAAFAIAVLGFVFFQMPRASQGNKFVDEVVSNHVRSLLATHLVDVASSDQHTVKPWFDGKIDFAPDVHDFAASGFPLVGGRLDYLGGKSVVALVYQRNKHPINLFITPAVGSRDSSPISFTRRGYNLLSWVHRDMRYWAVSDLNETELKQFASLISG
jgi:anti-sigma factor RsiW